MKEDKSKSHDSIMNTLDWSIECATGLDWMEYSQSVQYNAISKAVWQIVHGEIDTGEDE